jgi:hypothetical protein
MTDPLAVRLTRELVKAAQLLGRAEPDAMLRLADDFGIGGYVRRQQRGDPATVESGAAELMRRLQDRLLLDAAAEVSQGLGALTIPHFFAKGVALLHRVYRLGDRELADIDLYVHRSAARLAVQTLEELGFRAIPLALQSGPAALRPGVVLAREGYSEAQGVTLDVHWGIEPVDRLLPRANIPIPDAVWDRLVCGADLPVPTSGHHAALVVYHLVHHDLLHVRGLLDLALLWRDLEPEDLSALSELARALGVERALRALALVLARDLGLPRPESIGPPASDWRGRRLTRLLVLHRWLAWAGAAGEREPGEITPRRVGRRLLLLDAAWRAALVLGDVLAPPRAHLRWRWPDAESDVAAWGRHLRSAARKALPR